ncbi:MAG: alanine dehydrogenase [Actinobacteria bacterium RBG_19FT_COMBO_36_27]|nr:MAG: alanine dehydrogenase [Actinobacteria bacterium RBG_19FT_COMBO_36_27]
MKIGCVKEVKNCEFRVGVIPATVASYVRDGHTVYIEKNAGSGSSISNEDYKNVGATIIDTAKDVWNLSEMIVKVKEPIDQEYDLMKEEQIIYTYFHFAASEKLTLKCLQKKIIAVAYETVRDSFGQLPLLKPMSEVAGSMAPLVGSFFLMRPHGGIGILPSGVSGVLPARVVIIGGGIVGQCAARVAAGMGSYVVIFDNNLGVLTEIKKTMPSNVFTQYSNEHTINEELKDADLVIGAVLIPGAKAPKVITKKSLSLMKKGAVIVDVAIDQGGCTETSHATTHSEPVYDVDGIVHYCVDNMPGAYSRTSTFALNYATISYGLDLANRGVMACKNNIGLQSGINMYKGKITHKAVSEAFGMQSLYKNILEIL